MFVIQSILLPLTNCDANCANIFKCKNDNYTRNKTCRKPTSLSNMTSIMKIHANITLKPFKDPFNIGNIPTSD